ncbi:ATP-binding protein [Sphaerisporangium sp. B11E5]|uniref:ATP-binding protein n=1 Tax=Sphaerisporangium sp. B11E5 TaxID=3153563 RepID=UPI00325C622D
MAPQPSTRQASGTAARTAGTVGPTLSRTFAPVAEQVRGVRRFVAGVLGDGHACREDAVLLVSELAGNVVRHAAGREFLVSVAFTGGGVVVAVEDGGAGTVPLVRVPGVEETDGRGLLLVDRIAGRWGFERRGAGTVVWFELEGSGGAGGADVPAAAGFGEGQGAGEAGGEGFGGQ